MRSRARHSGTAAEGRAGADGAARGAPPLRRRRPECRPWAAAARAAPPRYPGPPSPNSTHPARRHRSVKPPQMTEQIASVRQASLCFQALILQPLPQSLAAGRAAAAAPPPRVPLVGAARARRPRSCAARRPAAPLHCCAPRRAGREPCAAGGRTRLRCSNQRGKNQVGRLGFEGWWRRKQGHSPRGAQAILGAFGERLWPRPSRPGPLLCALSAVAANI
jgi:hypothetical protein